MNNLLGIIGYIWGFLGISYMILHGLSCMIPYVIELDFRLFKWYHMISFFGVIIILGYSEGYKGFQKSFSPRTANRLYNIFLKPTFFRVFFSPFISMGFIESSKKLKYISYGLLLMIVMFILLIGKLNDPWRGIIDAGVIVGLSWGLVSFWVSCFRVILKNSKIF